MEFSGWKKAPELRGKDWALMTGAFRETRPFKSGAQLLGYLEGRPGATRLLRHETWGPSSEKKRPVPRDVAERIRDSAAVRRLPKSERAQFREVLEALWWEAEDFGVNAEFEIDYEAVPS